MRAFGQITTVLLGFGACLSNRSLIRLFTHGSRVRGNPVASCRVKPKSSSDRVEVFVPCFYFLALPLSRFIPSKNIESGIAL